MPKGGTTVRRGDIGAAVERRARGGDSRAFRAVVSHYDRGLRALAYGLLDDVEQMDDVLREVYVEARRGLTGLRADAGLGAWLYRVTYDACMVQLGHPLRPAAVLPPEAPAPGPGEEAAGRSALAAALAALPPEQRAAVLLVDAEGFDHATAAHILGVAEGTVHSRVSQAHAALRERLGRIGGDR